MIKIMQSGEEMRKVSYMAGLGLCLLLCACSRQKPIRLLADAEIVSIDSRNQTIIVRDLGMTTTFGEHGTVDCSKASLSGYDADTDKEQEITLDDLSAGDYVIVGFYDNEKEQAQNEIVHAESVEWMIKSTG